MLELSFYAGFMDMLRKQGIEKTAAYAKEQGFTAVEFLELPFDEDSWVVKTPEEAAKVKDVLARYGLKVACYSAAVDFWTRPDDVEGLKKMIPIVAALGCPYLHHMMIPWLKYPENAPSYEEALPYCLEKTVEVADYAKAYGVSVLYEGQGLYFNGVTGMKPFITALSKRCSNVGIVGDVGNPLFAGCAPENFFKEFGPYIKHVHMKDYTIRQLEEDPGRGWLVTESGAHGIYVKEQMPGEGDIDLESCIDVLKKMNYQGAVSLESAIPSQEKLDGFKAWAAAKLDF